MAENNGSRRVAIACQGGGSHTAFTAGVLKKLLKEKGEGRRDYELVALSGTSGGAICALLTWYELLTNDTIRAVELLNSFWREFCRLIWGQASPRLASLDQSVLREYR